MNIQAKTWIFEVDTQSLCDESAGLMEWSAAEEKEKMLLAMSKAMADVDEDSRTLPTEKYEDGLPIVELHSRYGISESAMKMRLSRARKRVQDRHSLWIDYGCDHRHLPPDRQRDVPAHQKRMGFRRQFDGPVLELPDLWLFERLYFFCVL